MTLIPKILKPIAFTALIGTTLSALPNDARAEHPFARLTGTWTGNGQAHFEQGKSEAIACKAYYSPKAEGSTMGLAIRCASASYKIEMRANLSSDGDRVAGHWEERSFNAEGGVDGHATKGGLNLAITGGISGAMSVSIDQSGHRVDITTSGVGLAGVPIKFNRG